MGWSHRDRHTRWRGGVLAVLGLIVPAALATGCADDPPPGERAPQLAEQLAVVDAEIEDGDLRGARTAVEELVSRTALALTADEISEDDADRILDAARALLAELPDRRATGTNDSGGEDDGNGIGRDDGHGDEPRDAPALLRTSDDRRP